MRDVMSRHTRRTPYELQRQSRHNRGEAWTNLKLAVEPFPPTVSRVATNNNLTTTSNSAEIPITINGLSHLVLSRHSNGHDLDKDSPVRLTNRRHNMPSKLT